MPKCNSHTFIAYAGFHLKYTYEIRSGERQRRFSKVVGSLAKEVGSANSPGCAV